MKRLHKPLPFFNPKQSPTATATATAATSAAKEKKGDETLTFYFNDKPYAARLGDSVASALLAQGVRLFGRSFKYHRPRGVVGLGVEEPNALLTIGQGAYSRPNIPATTIDVFEGLRVYSQNAWPSVAWDWRSVNSLFSPLFAAGFYYKTFMGPMKNTKAWMFFEHHIRQAAGLGRLDFTPVKTEDELRFEWSHDFCDVLIVGGGVAGLEEALNAVQAGKDVVLVEQEAVLGGQALWEAAASPERERLAGLLKQIEHALASGKLAIHTRSTAFGLYDSQTVGVVQRHFAADGLKHDQTQERFRVVRAEEMVLCCGALERPLVFAGNDRPGVMLASAVRGYLHRYGVLLGERVLVCGNNDTALQTALDLAKAGSLVTLADLREELSPEWREALAAAKVEVYTRACVLEAHAAKIGQKAVYAATLAHYDSGSGNVGAQLCRVDVDLVAMSGGFTPSVHLATHLGHKPVFYPACHSYVPSYNLPPYLRCAGSMTGAYLPSFNPAAPLQGGISRGKAFLDFQHDVHTADIELAQREGYTHVELTKRYTTLGMATDQGKNSNMQALAMVAKLQGKSVPEVGTTTFRAPFTPVSVGALAGRSVGAHYRPVRRTAIEPWHKAHGAVWTEAGMWRRALWYKENGDDIGTAYKAEMDFVREGTGIADVSTLGKIDVQGPDAAEFLNRVYINGFAKLPVGKARYGLMLREDGMVLDDGTTSRLSDTHFFMTTTTAQAGRVMSHLEWLLQVVWPELRVTVASSTDQWATMSIAGVNSRAILQAAFPSLDFSPASIPHMGVLEGSFAASRGGALTLRFIRLSFSGELAYEVYAPTHLGQAVWEHILQAGKTYGLRVYGLEALASLRIEKGHVVGSELDGRTTAADVGLGKMASKLKPYWGSALSQSPDLVRDNRAVLVGLEALEDGQPPSNGSILFFEGEALRGTGRGHISSYCYSKVLGKNIALGLLEGGLSHEGKTIVATSPVHNRTYKVKVVSPAFFDASGARYQDAQPQSDESPKPL